VGLLISPGAQAIRVEGAVGAIGWVLPTVAILDTHGLNDLAIARNPPDPAAPRIMAHDRIAPKGYLDCFHANAETPLNKVIIGERAEGLETLVPRCENYPWEVTRFRPDEPNSNMALAPGARPLLDSVWTPDPLFINYVPPGQAPSQTPADLVRAFEAEFHDTGCVVIPPTGAPDAYAFAFLPPNLRYAPEELAAMFPWARLVDFKRSRGPIPYNLAYAVPAEGAAAPVPATAHPIGWAPANLLGYTLHTPRLEPGGLLEVSLFFQVNQPAPTEQWFHLSLTLPAQPGAAISLDEADPCRGTYVAPLWQPGQIIVAKSIVPVPADLTAGAYTLELKMFDLAVGPESPLAATGDPVLVTLPIAGL
jgi:hypothetical protein